MRGRVMLSLNVLFILGALLTIGSTSTYADVPDSINYQGILTTSGGSPVSDGSYSVTFNVYDVASGINPALWSETKSVSTVGGLFTTQLGSVTPLPSSIFSGPNRWLGITVSPDPEMTPRAAIVAVAYAYRIATVDGATGGTISGDVSVSSGDLNLDYSSTTSGIIYKGGSRFIHDFGAENTFIGREAGNLTMIGADNTAIGRSALVAITSGNDNTASGYIALFKNTTGGSNTANGSGALINNTTGSSNVAVGTTALLGNTTGSNNTAIGSGANVTFGNLTNSTAIGNGATVNRDNAMKFGNANVRRWGFGAADDIDSSKALIVGTNGGNGNGAYLTTGGVWTNTSDRNLKEGITPVNGSDLLAKVSRLPVYSWNYIGEDPSRQHVGPMAQDFHAVFGIGDDDKHISTIDPAGVALAAIQALYEQQKSENQKLQTQIAELREMIRAQANNQK